MAEWGGRRVPVTAFQANDTVPVERGRPEPTSDFDGRSCTVVGQAIADFEAARRRARLARTIEGEIIPRLKLAHIAESAERAREGAEVILGTHRIPNAADIMGFAKLLISQDVGIALAHIDLLRAHGTSLEVVFLDLLAPAAKLLGDLWLADECTFIDVSIGLARLQQILRELSPGFEPERTDQARPDRRILLLPAPGEQHTFGLTLVECFLRRSGWEVLVGDPDDRSTIEVLHREWFTFVGLSMSCVGLLDGLRSCIGVLREASRNPELSVLVGGNAFNDHPDLVSHVGADATAGDSRLAVSEADRLLMLPGPSRGPARRNWKHDGAAGNLRHGGSV